MFRINNTIVVGGVQAFKSISISYHHSVTFIAFSTKYKVRACLSVRFHVDYFDVKTMRVYTVGDI